MTGKRGRDRNHDIAISACSFRSSASSSSSSTGAGALVFPFTVAPQVSKDPLPPSSNPLPLLPPSEPSLPNPIPQTKKKPRALTFPINPRRQRSLQLVLRHRARLEHLLVQVLLLQGREVGFQLVFVNGFGDGHAGDCVADFLGEFVLLAELFPVAAIRCQ